MTHWLPLPAPPCDEWDSRLAEQVRKIEKHGVPTPDGGLRVPTSIWIGPEDPETDPPAEDGP